MLYARVIICPEKTLPKITRIMRIISASLGPKTARAKRVTIFASPSFMPGMAVRLSLIHI